MRLNMSGVPSVGELLPKGAMPFQITDVELKTSDNSGNDYYSWELTIVDHPQFANRKRWFNTTLTENSMWVLKMLIEAATGEKVPEGEFDFDPKSLIMKKITGMIAHRVYEDEPQDYVKTVKPYKPFVATEAATTSTRRTARTRV